MSDVVELFPTVVDDALRTFSDLGDLGINIYVNVGRPSGAYCGATILFDIEPAADLRFHAMALVKSTRERFYADTAFREAVSHECFQLGSYVQHWNEPVPDLNF